MNPDCDSSSQPKDQSGEGAASSGGREEVGESSAARRGQTEAGGERAADSGATEAGGGGESCGAAEEEEGGERESSCKVIGGFVFSRFKAGTRPKFAYQSLLTGCLWLCCV